MSASTTTVTTKDKNLDDFSLVVGGPLYHVYLKTRLAREPLLLLTRRLLFFTFIAWVPLLVLSLLDGNAFDSVRIPFLHDFAAHSKYLIALPLLIAAELSVHRVMSPVVKQFLSREIVRGDDVARFSKIIDTTIRLRNNLWIELGLIALVYTAGHVLWLQNVPAEFTTWYGTRVGDTVQLTRAGVWYSWVSAPLLQFLLLRWYYRLLVWTLFLWRASKLDLHLIPTHPDHAAGLGFLTEALYAFGMVPMAQGFMMAGILADRIFYFGAKLTAFKGEIATMVIAMALVFLGPLCVFIPRLFATKRVGVRDYGRLGSEYVLGFDHKWLHGGAPADEELVGSGDIQSLADLSGSFDIVRSMRPTPFSLDQIIFLVLMTAGPIAPLILTMIPLEELLKKVAGAVF